MDVVATLTSVSVPAGIGIILFLYRLISGKVRDMEMKLSKVPYRSEVRQIISDKQEPFNVTLNDIKADLAELKAQSDSTNKQLLKLLQHIDEKLK